MSVPADNLAVLFVDVCDSARLYHELGDGVAHSLTTKCLSCVSEATTRNGGHVVKTTGDGALTTFPTVDQAYRTASHIQQSLREGPLRVKIGFHVGPVLHAQGDVFGSTVNLAARVLARSGPGEILMTRPCADTLSPLQRATVRLLDATIVKGQPDSVEIYRVIGEHENETTVVPSSAKTAGAAALVLGYDGKTIRLTATGAPVHIGRDPRCQLCIVCESSSRHHATIEVQRNGFALTDHSSNGTYLVDCNGNEQFLRRESALLTANGLISIGAPPEENPQGLIDYNHEGRGVRGMAGGRKG
jgi:class 3 adenylate cyclase